MLLEVEAIIRDGDPDKNGRFTPEVFAPVAGAIEVVTALVEHDVADLRTLSSKDRAAEPVHAIPSSSEEQEQRVSTARTGRSQVA